MSRNIALDDPHVREAGSDPESKALRVSRADRLRDVTRRWWRAMAFGLLICLLIAMGQMSGTRDRMISDALLVAQKHAASDDYVLVEITPADLRKYGRPMLKRENLALLMDRVAEQGADMVLLDLFLSDSVGPDADTALATALERLGPDRLGLVTGNGLTDKPHAIFARHATLLDARLTPDNDGWHRTLGRNGAGRGNNPALWLANGELSSEPLDIDLRIAHEGFEKATVDQVIEGKIVLAGRKVIIGAGPDVAPTRAYLPLTDSASRATILATATQSAAQAYRERLEQGWWLNKALLWLGALLGFACALMSSSGRRLALFACASLVALVALHIQLAFAFGTPVTAVAAIGCFFVMLNATLVQRFQIVPLLQNFLRGDLSPEEAWAWRAYEQTTQPTVLLGADGRVKRSNAAAAPLCDHFGNLLARECQPSAGERADEISLNDSGDRTRIFELDWPFAKLPIVTLRDVTLARAEQESLLGQLYEDELTGCVNRRGFDRELAAVARSGAPYELFFIDLNGFKQVNDTHGHDAGDELLVACAQRLQHNTRKGDVVARLGGDEFAILMRTVREGFDAEREIERLTGTIIRPVKLTTTGDLVAIGAAIGHARPGDMTEDASDVLRRADQAMYRNKSEIKGKDDRRAA